MALYFKDIEITNIDNLVPQTGLDITDLWFGSTNVYTVWATYEGTLPATFYANGDNLRQYQVFGNVGGVGDRTGNLVIERLVNTNVNTSGKIIENASFDMLIAPVIAGTAYSSSSTVFSWYAEKPTLGATAYDSTRYTKAFNNVSAPISGYVAVRTETGKNAMVFEGSTVPADYVPYGYEVDMSTSDGTSTTTVPIYIGDTALQKDEYADYAEQKVYRMIDGTLTPTDPPVPLPALPTCEGETTVDYTGGGAAPEKVLLKYRKEGF